MKRFSYLIEAVILFAIIIVFGSLLENPGFVGYDLHPFYLVILLITIRYGYGKSFFSTFFSIFIYTIFFVLNKGSLNIHDLSEGCYQPVLFLAFWMFIGLLVKLDKTKIQELTEVKINQEKTISDKDIEIKKINALNEKISSELITSPQSFNLLFERTKFFFSEDIHYLYRASYEILMKIILAKEAYILYLNEDNLEIAAPEKPAKDLNDLMSQSKEIDNVRKSHEFFRLDMSESSSISNQTPVFIGPIIHQATDTLYGLIIVQELDLMDYNKNTFRTLMSLCRWLGEIFYFRSNQNLDIEPVDRKSDFIYITEFGANSIQINNIVKECFT